MYKAAVWGLGRIGSLLEKDPYREKPCTHSGVVKEHPEVELLAGIDTDPKKREAFAKQWSCPKTFSSLKGLLEQETPDILHIATPTKNHLSDLNEAIEHKIPLIILEKPITGDFKDYAKCRKIANKIKRLNVRVVVNHERRFSLDYLYLKEHLLKKTWGDLESIFGFLYSNTRTKPHDILFHDGTHMIDILFFLLDKNMGSEVTTLGRNQPNHLMQVFFKMKKTPVFLEVSGRKEFFHFELVFNFTQGRFFIGNGIFRLEEKINNKLYQGIPSLEKTKTRKFAKTLYFTNMYRHAVSLLKDANLKNNSTFEDGMNLLKFFEKLS